MVWTWLERAGFVAAIIAAFIAVLTYAETGKLPLRLLQTFSDVISPPLGNLLIVLLGLFAICIGLLRLRRVGADLGRIGREFEATSKRLLVLEQTASPRTTFSAKSTWFESQGFRWEVLPNFSSQWRLHPPDGPNEAMLHATLDHIFQGPYCLREGCHQLVGDDVVNARPACSRCGAPLRPGVEIKAEGPRHNKTSAASSDPLWPLRRAAYRDAIAALLGGKLFAKMPSQDFLAVGEGLLGKLKSAVSEEAVRLVMEQGHKWEHDVCEWLKGCNPKAADIFMSNFEVPQGANLKDTFIARVSVRLERLKQVSLSLR
jgi:hypothetical protein